MTVTLGTMPPANEKIPTAIGAAFAKALKNKPMMPDHLVCIDGVFAREAEFGSVAPIPNDEISLIDSTYFVHACPLPAGYLDHQQRLVELTHRRETSQVRFVAAERMKYEGYTSAKEFNEAQLREAARWIGQNDQPIERMLTTPLIDLEAPRKPNPVVVRKRNHFHPSQLDEDPLSLISVEDQRRIVDQARLASRLLEGTCDWDAALTIVPCKIVDSMLLYGSERILHQIEEQGRAVVQQMAELRRTSTSEEITQTQLERLDAKRIALRVQHRHMALLHKGFLEERDETVSRAGIDWGKYLSIKDRAKRGAQAHRQQRNARTAQLETLRGMSPAQLADWNRRNPAYKPRHDGVDAGDEVPFVPAGPGEE
jgi:hypothetical protein